MSRRSSCSWNSPTASTPAPGSTLISCQVACDEIQKILENCSGQERLKTLILIEFLVKNCDMKFHRTFLNERVCHLFLRILERRRGKTAFFSKHISRNKETQKDVA